MTRIEAPVPERLTLDLIQDLCEALSKAGVVYCHWKSNAALDRSAQGENDLDLLVSRADSARFTEIVYRLGFKEALVPAYKRLPGIMSYYGYDQASDKLVHVHTHYQLILGDDLTKNYHLPVENAYLESAIQDGLFKVPAPEFEIIIFVIRMVLKHSTWDTILSRRGVLSPSERKEFEYLEPKANPAKIYGILSQIFPYLDVTTFNECIQSLQPGRPWWKRIQTGRRLQSLLKPYSRRSLLSDLSLKFWRRLFQAIQRRVSETGSKKRMVGGGAMIAIVGGDGAGKSTATDGLFTWLSKGFATKKVHLGKPRMSLTTIVVRAILKIGRLLGLYPYSRAPNQHTEDANAQIFPGYPALLRDICVARDRYLTYRMARRFTANGGLVICDRFPLPQIRLMDAPSFRRMASHDPDNWLKGTNGNALGRYLLRLEMKYYQPFRLPEVLIVLRVDPKIAVQRKVDEDPDSVRARSAEIWELDWRQIPAHIIDANRSRPEVFSELKPLIWSQL